MKGAQGSARLQTSFAQEKSPSLRLSVSVRAGQRFTAVLAGGKEGPRRSYVETFTTATRSFDVRVVEDKLAGEL